MKKTELTPEMDPRKIAYYNKAFPELTQEQRDDLRLNWIINNTKPAKLLKAEDFDDLVWGDTVWRSEGLEWRKLRFVGRMPGSPKEYFIFCDGEHLEHLYISTKSGRAFKGEWYKGEYNPYLAGAKRIKWHKKRIKSIERIYLKENYDKL